MRGADAASTAAGEGQWAQQHLCMLRHACGHRTDAGDSGQGVPCLTTAARRDSAAPVSMAVLAGDLTQCPSADCTAHLNGSNAAGCSDSHIIHQKATSTAQQASLLQQAQLKVAAVNVCSAKVAGGVHM